MPTSPRLPRTRSQVVIDKAMASLSDEAKHLIEEVSSAGDAAAVQALNDHATDKGSPLMHSRQSRPRFVGRNVATPQDHLQTRITNAIAAAASNDHVHALIALRQAMGSIARGHTKVPRAIVFVLLIAQMVLLLIASIISAQYRDTIPENVRTCTILAALGCTAACLRFVSPRSMIRYRLRILAALKTLSFVFEMQLFAIGNDWPILFLLGIITMAATLVIFAMAGLAHMWMSDSDPDGMELVYTAFAAGVDELQNVAENIHEKVQDDVRKTHPDLEQSSPSFEHLVKTCHKLFSAEIRPADNMFAVNRLTGDEEVAGTAEAQPATAPGEKKKLNWEEELEAAVENTADIEQPKHQLYQWYCVNRMRKVLYDKDAAGAGFMVTLLVFAFFCAMGNVAYEFGRIFANQPPLFSDSLNDKYNAQERVAGYFGSTRSHATYKVHMVVVDGLRFDMTEAGASALGALFARPGVAANSTRLEMRAQLPSFSVPNWLSLLSGAPPEQTGITGNLLSSETSYDHVFRQCENYGVHTGLTGTPWWRDLIFSTVPTLDGDGTVWASYTPPGTPEYAWTTSNPADEARLGVALTAVVRSRIPSPFGAAGATSLYDFFLTHFSDVDAQGHEYGVSTDWNERDTYQGAITNKTAAIERIMAEMDDRTILVVTSDHGHVLRGGHGGVSDVLRKVPVFFYSKSLPIASLVASAGAAPQAFPASAGPRFGAYENTDLVATLCALLGIPAPRQTTGIFMEEIVRALVPAAALPRHYYDLFRARYSLIEQMSEYIGEEFVANQTESGEINTPFIQSLFASNGNATDRDYGTGIRTLHSEYQRMRDIFANFDMVRNLVGGIFVLILGIFCLVSVFEQDSIASLFAIFELRRPNPNDKVDLTQSAKMEALVDPRSACAGANAVACVKAFLTVFLHVALSLAVFLIGYFSITGYNVWDSTITHTPSVAVTFLTRTVVAPVIIFVLLTRIFLAPAFVWRLENLVHEARGGAVDPLRWFQYLCADIITFCFGTRHYRREKFPDAYLYLYWLAFWSTLTALLVLFLCFPFSFMIPVVFATPYVNEGNQEMKFRIITMLMLILPLLLGTALLLLLRPPLSPKTLPAWNDTLVLLQVLDDHRIVRRTVLNMQEQHAGRNGEGGSKPSVWLLLAELRLQLLTMSLNLLAATDLMFLDESLALAPGLEPPTPKPPQPAPAPAWADGGETSTKENSPGIGERIKRDVAGGLGRIKNAIAGN